MGLKSGLKTDPNDWENVNETRPEAYVFRRKRKTFLDWVSSGLSIGEAAKASGLHRNTVVLWLTKGEAQLATTDGILKRGQEYAKFYLDFSVAKLQAECHEDWSQIPEEGLPVNIEACKAILKRK